mmetsp:Transcript_43566/g.130648  ORF Transcript_43566/g.130648 Transcript_43566/m.130648 type:complete len:128 (-) Transcript_43566:169-552(-)
MASAARQEMSREVEAYTQMRTDMNKLVTTRTQLESQVNENDMVLEELGRLDDDANVFKMIGPAMIKQDLVEAKSNINKRIEYIKGEIGRTDGKIKGIEGKLKEKEAEIMKLQQRLEKAAAVAPATTV